LVEWEEVFYFYEISSHYYIWVGFWKFDFGEGEVLMRCHEWQCGQRKGEREVSAWAHLSASFLEGKRSLPFFAGGMMHLVLVGGMFEEAGIQRWLTQVPFGASEEAMASIFLSGGGLGWGLGREEEWRPKWRGWDWRWDWMSGMRRESSFGRGAGSQRPCLNLPWRLVEARLRVALVCLRERRFFAGERLRKSWMDSFLEGGWLRAYAVRVFWTFFLLRVSIILIIPWDMAGIVRFKTGLAGFWVCRFFWRVWLASFLWEAHVWMISGLGGLRECWA
jgi:hypothetical protein